MRTFAALAIILLAALPAHAQGIGKTRGVVEQYLIEKGILDASGTPTGGSITINTTSPLAGGTTGTTFTLSIDTAASLQALSLKVGGTDVVLARQGAAGVLGLHNATNSAALRVYNTTDAATGAPTNAEWVELAWSGNVCTIQPAKSGSGTVRTIKYHLGSDVGMFRSAAGTIDVYRGSGFNPDGYLRAYRLIARDVDGDRINILGENPFGAQPGIHFGSTGMLAWSGAATNPLNDYGTVLARQGADGVLGLLNGDTLTNPAALRVYNTTDARTGAPTNSEFIAMRWSSNVAIIEPSVTGTGTQRNLELRGNGTNNRIILYANNNIDFSSNGLFNFAGAQIILNSGAYFSYYYGTATAGLGVPAIYASASGPGTDRTAAVDPVCSFVVGGSDQTFDVGGYVIVTDGTTISANLYCYYTDPGNNAQTMAMDFLKDAGSYGTLIGGAGSYAFFKHTIRAKAGSTITLKTTGTFTTCHYKVDGHIIQLTK